MSSLPKRQRVKRPTILVKLSQVTKKNTFNNRSYKPQKLKANNNALAKALSKEKQETQYLFSENIALTGEVQDLVVTCNRHDTIISSALKNAKDTLQLLIAMSAHVTNTIASCQQVVTTSRFTPRKSTANNVRDSIRRLSGKSPARGVVQPMVSGHTITKPTINLSRLNIQRVRNEPDLSTIEEVLSPNNVPLSFAESNTPVRMHSERSHNYESERMARSERLQRTSLRVNDENERRSSIRNNRISNRHSGYRSRRESGQFSEVAVSGQRSRDPPEVQHDGRLRSPRVALHDVSRLLQNSQSVNIRTLLESSSDMEITQSLPTVASPEMETSGEEVVRGNALNVVPESSEESEPPADSPAPSPSLRRQRPDTTTHERTITTSNFYDNSNSNNDNDEDDRDDDDGDDDGDDDDRDEDESPATPNLGQFATSNLGRFVTRKRGSVCDDDDDDYTLLWKRRGQPKNYNFGLNDLELPVLESPIFAAPEPRVLEPEPTTNVQRITQSFANFVPTCPTANAEETVYEHTGLILPVITEDPDPTSTSNHFEQDEQSDEKEIGPRKRKRQYRKRMTVDSASDSDWAPTEGNSKAKRKMTKVRDPSSAKVVLQKLNESYTEQRSPSLESRHSRNAEHSRRSSTTSSQRDVSSDLEGSSVSLNSENPPGRPRRTKAPKNLKEPSLMRKLRRQ